jgi:hypothetical protein
VLVPIGDELALQLLDHPVRSLIADAELALELLGGDPAAGARQEVDGVEPQL